MGRNNLSGAWGEALAAEYLKKKKYRLIAAGYRCRFGEIDLIVADKKNLVFVEVKLRKNADMTQENLAEILSISPQAVSRWETDMAMPDLSLLAPLSRLFKVSADELLGIDITQMENEVDEIMDIMED